MCICECEVCTQVLAVVLQVTQQAGQVWLCMADPSNNPDHPGWPLRNMLLMAAKRWKATTLSVLCVRDHRGRLDAARSLCLAVTLPTIPAGVSLPTALPAIICTAEVCTSVPVLQVSRSKLAL